MRRPHPFHHRFSARALGFGWPAQSARTVDNLLAAAGSGFLDGLFHRFPGFAGALLNAAQQFVVLAFGALQIVIRELGPLLLELALGDVPVALDFECVHVAMFCFLRLWIAVVVTAKVNSSQWVSCRCAG